MNTKLQRFAPLGLYLALVAAIAAAGLYIVQREFNLYLQIALALIVVGLAIFAVFDPGKVRKAFTGRQAQYGSNALIMILAVLGILVVINYLVYKYPKRWDLTEDKSHTLAQETLNTLKALPGKVTADAFYTKNYNSDSARTVLNDYKYNSNGNFDFTFIDPDADPVAAQNAKITQDGSVVLHLAGRQEMVTSVSEQELTSALIRLANPDPRTVYFLTGHGEHDPSGTGDTSYSDARQALESKNYTVKTLNLLANSQIPTDAKAIIIAGPQKPVSENEVKLLQDYVDKGGSLVVLEEPTAVTEFGDSPDPLAEYLSQKWNVVLGKDMVIDTTANPATVAVSATFGNHAIITSKLKTLVPIFPTARSVTLKDSSTETGGSTIISTANQSWAETNMTDLAANKAQYDQGQDLMGPVPVVAVNSNTTTNAHIVVIGDSDFATNRWYTQYGNSDMFVNSVDWAAGQQSLIDLTPKTTTNRLMITPQKYTINLIFLGSVFVIPGLVLFSGVMVWIQRRRRG